jgi:hypothetical protein
MITFMIDLLVDHATNANLSEPQHLIGRSDSDKSAYWVSFR